ncbi:MAG TPA: ATP-binding cassette domain-containing protein [Methanocorpusculum sp.]|nr:ATP-binding cassette domain-containing protein [Methanocorpusculum sp.]HJJ53071.1 ATP-binding cassette domain-containing protein [Methanocorpusculum sp.]
MTDKHDLDHHDHEGEHVHPHVHSEGYIHTHEHVHGVAHEHHTNSPSPALLNVDCVNFDYRTVSVLEKISVGVARGEILAILGPNGVGKSTLLKCMNLILKPKTGIIMLGELDLTRMNGNDIAKNVGYVAQRNESSRMTVFDSVLLGRKPHIGWHVTDRDYSIVENAIEKFGLSDMQLRYIDELSGGELQRVCLCRAIVQEPSVLLLDEPTSALDLCRQMEILRAIRNVVDQHNVATIMTMHDLNLALRFADRFLFMKEGKIYALCDRSGVTADMIEAVYGICVDVIYHKDMPIVVPCQ